MSVLLWAAEPPSVASTPELGAGPLVPAPTFWALTAAGAAAGTCVNTTLANFDDGVLFTDTAAHKSEGDGEGEGEGEVFTARRWRLTGAGGGERRSSTGCVPADDTGVLVRP